MGFKGLVNFASGIKTGEIVTGEEAAKDLIDNRLIVSIDPGLVNLAAITFAFGRYNSSTTSFDGQFAKKLISAKSVSRDTSLTNYINRANESNEFANLIDELSKQHGRTMNVADYMAHSTAFQANAEPLLQAHNSRQARRSHARLQSKKQRFWSNTVNLIFAFNDAMANGSNKTPIIIFGDGSFGNVKGCQSGNYTWLKQYLSRFFTVLIVNEHNTSQKCPKCFGQLKMHEPTKGVRVKCCEKCVGHGPTGKFVVNRDVSAGMNMITIVLCMILSGKRPAQFSPKGN